MAWTVRAGTSVRYRDANGRVHHATVVGVDDADTIDLRIGHGGTPIEAVSRVEARSSTAGWYRFGSILDGTEEPA